MKLLQKIIVLLCLFLGNCVSAETFSVLVLPVDLFSVCENYYCFPEPSEILAADTINYFNKSGKVSAFDLYSVRKKLTDNPSMKNAAMLALKKYKNTNTVEFVQLKQLAKFFDTKSILMISSDVVSGAYRRSVWEVLEVSSVFEIYNTYNLETRAVLTDNVNDIIMWSGKYSKSLGDNETRFWALSTSQALSQLEKLKLYSKQIMAKNIAEQIVLRFYPKTMKPVIPKQKTETTDFRPSPLNNNGVKLLDDDEYGEIHTEAIFDF